MITAFTRSYKPVNVADYLQSEQAKAAHITLHGLFSRTTIDKGTQSLEIKYFEILLLWPEHEHDVTYSVTCLFALRRQTTLMDTSNCHRYKKSVLQVLLNRQSKTALH